MKREREIGWKEHWEPRRYLRFKDYGRKNSSLFERAVEELASPGTGSVLVSEGRW